MTRRYQTQRFVTSLEEAPTEEATFCWYLWISQSSWQHFCRSAYPSAQWFSL